MSTIKVLITDGMAESGVGILKGASSVPFEIDLRKSTSADELATIIGNYHCIVIRSATTLTAPLIQAATQMKLIVRAGAGVDNIDVKVATEKKISVMNTASANSLAAAEQTIALLFAMFRQVPQAAQSLRDGKWERDLFKGHEVTGKTLGVIGLGNIGRLVAERGIGLGMKVIGFDPVVQNSPHKEIRVVRDIDTVMNEANVITLHIPKTKDTANLVNTDRIAKMKKGSFIINCARGGLVDEKAVIAALDSGHLAGAAFDVYEKEPPAFPNPLFSHPKIVCAPHLGASTHEAQGRVATTAAEQMIGFFSKGDRTGIIN